MNQKPNWKQRLSTGLAESFLLRRGRELHEKNPTALHLGGNILHKFLANLYLILADYGQGKFPPRHTSREAVFASEQMHIARMNVARLEETLDIIMRNPWVDQRLFELHLRDLLRI